MDKTIITLTVENGEDVRDIVKELADGECVYGRISNCMIKIQRIDKPELMGNDGSYEPEKVAGQADNA